jgi:hypothetical protein
MPQFPAYTPACFYFAVRPMPMAMVHHDVHVACCMLDVGVCYMVIVIICTLHFALCTLQLHLPRPRFILYIYCILHANINIYTQPAPCTCIREFIPIFGFGLCRRRCRCFSARRGLCLLVLAVAVWPIPKLWCLPACLLPGWLAATLL